MKQRTKQGSIAIAMLGVVTMSGYAQTVTYNHDSSKQNQVTVMETGVGTLSPELYYWTLHNSYKKTAATKNKQSFRTLAGLSLYEQVNEAEAIDSALTERAKIEALNITDRTVDIAWLAEGSKINNKMDAFQKNIDRIMTMGGSYRDHQRWTEYFRVYQCAITSVKESYMPNAERKKRYLGIYIEVAKQNEILVKQLVQYNTAAKTKELLVTTSYQQANKSAIISSALGRWRKSSKNGQDDTQAGSEAGLGDDISR